MEDYESVPDVVQSGSMSDSADLDAMATKIAAELFNGMIDQYKDENEFLYEIKPE
jgi:cation transport regulator ChaB